MCRCVCLQGEGRDWDGELKGQTNNNVLRNKLQRKLRHRMTDAELHLWRYLRGRQLAGFKFRRQHSFEDYILDFVCLEQMLVVEVDGGQHTLDAAADDARTKKLIAAGFRVLRFWNNQVLNEVEVVKGVIWENLVNPSPPRSSLCTCPGVPIERG